ncbi:MBL fold metallo-hydrolase [Clostridium chrysemydis]|uniref:MBL fold metallo-hydrolase n=1 Tax=Clostridium chrysemydis TaxID=2665504 RepID=UPI0018836E01|nr:MBL fold metallo-hydrolase [Clostridium chrysemydis]
MNITWLGNSTFLIKTEIGKRLLIDPINKFHSCNIKELSPNVITFSDYSKNYICLDDFDPTTKIIKEPGIYDSEIGQIIGIKTYSDNFFGAKRGENTIFVFEIDGFKICHLGYLGCPLTSNLLDDLKGLDVLFIPVGGNVNLNSTEAYKLCKTLSPKVIIPMNYKISNLSFLFDDIQPFILLMKDAYKIQNQTLNLTKEDLTFYKEKVIILPFNSK